MKQSIVLENELKQHGLCYIVESQKQISEYIIEYTLKSPIKSKIRHRLQIISNCETSIQEAVKSLVRAMCNNS